MPVKCKDVIEIMNELAPPDLALKSDNPGLMVGDEESDVSSILVSLDVSDDVCKEAVDKKCSLIVTHHPLIFHPLNRIDYTSPRGRMIKKLVLGGINVFSAHTNLDAADGGINDYLARIIGLKDVTILDAYPVIDDTKKYGLGRVGFLERSVSLMDFCLRLKELLHVGGLNVVGKLDRKILKVALCSGSGGEFIYDAAINGCDAYLTGDIKYHDACDARDMGLALIDGGHFETESIYMGCLADYLKSNLDKKGYHVNVYLSSANKSPFIRI